MKTIALIIIATLLTLHAALAQQKPATSTKPNPTDSVAYKKSIYLLGKFYGDSVVLRWAPADPLLWKACNETGYVIERMEVTPNMTTRPARAKITTTPIKPWTLEQWKARAKRTDSTAAVAATLLYGKTNLPTFKPDKRGKTNDVDLGAAMDQRYDQENRYAMAMFIADNDVFVANGLGLGFVDRTMQKGKTYLYSIHAPDAAADSAAVFINTTRVQASVPMPEIRYEELDQKVTFKWSRTVGNAYFTAYNIERSDDGGKTFKRRNKKPFVQPLSSIDNKNDQIVYTDSVPRNYKTYYFRVTGITAFGDLGLPSPTIPVTGADRTAPAAPLGVKAEHLGKRKVKLTWQKHAHEQDFAGYMVGRSESMNGPFAPLTLKPLTKETVTYTDTTAVPWGTNYYVVSAVDTARNAGISIPAYVTMIDTVAPLKPIGLHGRIDTTGIVHLAWTLGKERDLMGYLVYRANAKDHTFVAITRNFVADSTFTDSLALNTLTEKIFYRVVAVDKNRNPSAYSDMVELKKPDKVIPVAPVFTTFAVSDTTVAMTWAASSSDDARTQTLYRREPGGTWTMLASLSKDSVQYVDKTVKKQTWYEYSLVATDDDGNQSERSFPLKVRVYDSGLRHRIEGFSARVNADNRTVNLQWKYMVKGDYYFLVYRSWNGGAMEMYRHVPGGSTSFADNNLAKGTYTYAVKAMYADGSQSLITQHTKVEIR